MPLGVGLGLLSIILGMIVWSNTARINQQIHLQQQLQQRIYQQQLQQQQQLKQEMYQRQLDLLRRR
jgi:hypothetical protein